MNHPWEEIYRTEGQVFEEPFHRLPEIVSAFREHGCRMVLDLGCGPGRHTIHLAKAGFEVTGLDISPSRLGLAKSWLDEEGLSASLIQADFGRPLPFGDDSFEAVFSTQVIHHALLAEVLAVIDQIWRMLAPGGLAFISVAGRIHDDTIYEQIEPGTYVPLTGTEAGLPHHIFNSSGLRSSFSAFNVKYVKRRDDGRVIASLIQKP